MLERKLNDLMTEKEQKRASEIQELGDKDAEFTAELKRLNQIIKSKNDDLENIRKALDHEISNRKEDAEKFKERIITLEQEIQRKPKSQNYEKENAELRQRVKNLALEMEERVRDERALKEAELEGYKNEQ